MFRIKTTLFSFVVLVSLFLGVLLMNNILSKSPSGEIPSGFITDFTSPFIPYEITVNNSPIHGYRIFQSNQDSVTVKSGLDSIENVIIAGYTSASNIQTTNDAFQNTLQGNYDVFLIKYSSDGSLLWSTYLGGSGNDIVFGLEVNTQTNDIYVCGWTASENFPTIFSNSSSFQGAWDLFFSIFNENGQLTYSTLWGTGGGDEGLSLALNNDNSEIIIAGRTIVETDNQGLLLKFDLENRTFTNEVVFGGSGVDIAWDAKYDNEDYLYVVGETQSSNFTTKNALQAVYKGNQDGFIQKYTPDMNLIYSSFFGGSNGESFRSVECVGSDQIFVGGSTNSDDLPGNFSLFGVQASQNLFISLINLNSSSITTVHISGNQDDQLINIFVRNESIYFLGRTNSISGLPLMKDFQQSFGGGIYDSLIGKISINLSSIEFLSYFGYNGDDQILDLSITNKNEMIAVGRTNSSVFLSLSTSGFKNSFMVSIGDFSDSDSDGMPLWFESKFSLNEYTNDADLDSDHDLISNKDEFLFNYNPNDSFDGLNYDSDLDKIPDGWEIHYKLNPFYLDSLFDYDGDSLTNLLEYLNNFDPINFNDKMIDYDNDGLSNYEEIMYGTNPYKSDSDNDGFNDFSEVLSLGFLKSTPSQGNDSPLTRVFSFIILSSLFYIVIIVVRIQYKNKKKEKQVENDNMIKEIQNLIDSANQDYSEIIDQVSTLEETLRTFNPDNILILKKSIQSLYGPIRDLERLKNRLHLYRNNPMLGASIIHSIEKINSLNVRYNNLQVIVEQQENKISFNKKSNLLCKNCGIIIENGKGECPNCHIKVAICSICKKSISLGQESAECKNCNHQFHHGHLAETVKIQGRCPVCFETINFDEIVPFLMY
jgi:hypothetical protein